MSSQCFLSNKDGISPVIYNKISNTDTQDDRK